jgi:serine/threonine protein kinase
MQRARPPSATLRATASFDIGGAAPAPAVQVPEISARDLELVRVLGRGGQKTVSLCRHRPTGALVVRCTVADALSLAVSAASAPLLLQRLYAEFRAEVAILSSLKHHKNIVKLLALVSDSLEDDARAAARPGVGAIGNFPGFGGPPVASHMRRLEQADAKASAAPPDASGNSLSFLLEYCGFGSLRDAMHSPAIELTDALKARIAKSCARAVHFLHSQPSPIIHRAYHDCLAKI